MLNWAQVAAFDQTDEVRSPLSRWRASGRRASVLPAPPVQPVVAAEAVEKPAPLQAPDPEALLAAIEEASASVVPPSVLALFLAPVRAMLVLPLEQRDLVALGIALDQVEDLLTAFFLCGPTKPEGA